MLQAGAQGNIQAHDGGEPAGDGRVDDDGPVGANQAKARKTQAVSDDLLCELMTILRDAVEEQTEEVQKTWLEVVQLIISVWVHRGGSSDTEIGEG